MSLFVLRKNHAHSRNESAAQRAKRIMWENSRQCHRSRGLIAEPPEKLCKEMIKASGRPDRESINKFIKYILPFLALTSRYFTRHNMFSCSE